MGLIAAEWAGDHRRINVLGRVAAAAPSAELTGAEGAQLDEEDMGMSYDELGVSRFRVPEMPSAVLFPRRYSRAHFFYVPSRLLKML